MPQTVSAKTRRDDTLGDEATEVCLAGPESAMVLEHAKAGNADVAQLVAHHLAKVRVASSNLVIRSVKPRGGASQTVVVWPRGEAAACKAVYTGSNPVATSLESRQQKGRLAQR